MAEVVYEELEIVPRAVRVPDAVIAERDKLIAEGKCIGCKEKHLPDAVVRRGLCNCCYRAFTRHKNKRKFTQSDLIREGKLLPRGTTGRKPANKFTQELAQR